MKNQDLAESLSIDLQWMIETNSNWILETASGKVFYYNHRTKPGKMIADTIDFLVTIFRDDEIVFDGSIRDVDTYSTILESLNLE